MNKKEEQELVYKRMRIWIEEGNENKVKELVKKYRISYFDCFRMHGLPLLCIVAHYGYDSLMRWLVEKGWDLNESEYDSGGYHALFYVATDEKKDMFAYLIEKGIDMNHRGDLGGTVLIGSMITGALEIAKIAYEKGVDVNIKDYEGLDLIDHMEGNLDKEEIKIWIDKFLKEPERFDERLWKKIKAKRMELLF